MAFSKIVGLEVRPRTPLATSAPSSPETSNLRRGLLVSGELGALVASGVRGLTSNPTIFEKAIVSSTDYEEALRKLVAAGLPPTKIYEELAVEDIRGACDLMLAVYEQSRGVDGRVSLEVLPEL